MQGILHFVHERRCRNDFEGVEYVPSGRRGFLLEGEWLWPLTMVLTADLMSLSKGRMVKYCSRPRLTVRMARSA